MSLGNKRRSDAIRNLGGKCVVCGEMCIYVLEIDHKDNDGYVDKQKHISAYANLCRLAEGDDLERFQILCANCHAIKTKFGKQADIKHIRRIRATYSMKTIYPETTVTFVNDTDI
jgi:hypothetical protein